MARKRTSSQTASKSSKSARAAASKPAASGKKPAKAAARKPAPAAVKPAKPAARRMDKGRAIAAVKEQSRARAAVKPAAPAAGVKMPPKPVKPAKPVHDQAFLSDIQGMLLHRREQLSSVLRSNREQLAESTKDYADIGDRASGGFEDELAAGLLSLETAQMDEVEGALKRIEAGVYGVCLDCGKAIPRKRLEILPFAKRCLDCEGQKERHVRPFGAAYEDEEGDSE